MFVRALFIKFLPLFAFVIAPLLEESSFNDNGKLIEINLLHLEVRNANHICWKYPRAENSKMVPNCNDCASDLQFVVTGIIIGLTLQAWSEHCILWKLIWCIYLLNLDVRLPTYSEHKRQHIRGIRQISISVYSEHRQRIHFNSSYVLTDD